jgi:hypothetical protein
VDSVKTRHQEMSSEDREELMCAMDTMNSARLLPLLVVTVRKWSINSKPRRESLLPATIRRHMMCKPVCFRISYNVFHLLRDITVWAIL